MLSRLTINSTQTCNLGCTYCYALGGDYGGPELSMPPDLAVQKMREAAEAHQEIQLVQFIGGEPLLNLATLQAVADEIDRLVTRGVLAAKPQMSAVTNLTVLTKSHLELFRVHNFHPVVSIDGPRAIHDAVRPTKGGRGSHTKILHNLARLEDYGISYDVECTYTREHYRAGISIVDLLMYFTERTRAEEIDIVVVSTSPGDPLGFNQHDDWRIPVQLQLEAVEFTLDQMEMGRLIPYGSFLETVKQIQGSGSDHYCPAGTSNLAVASDGDLYQCNMFTNNPRYRTSIDATSHVITKSDIAECRECWARSWCLACVGNMEIRSPGDPHPYPQHCETLRGAIALILERLPSALDAMWNSSSDPKSDPAWEKTVERLEEIEVTTETRPFENGENASSGRKFLPITPVGNAARYR